MTQDEGHHNGGVGVEDAVRQRLRSLRLARGWSLDELGRRAHMGASTISRIETGHRRLALDHLVALADALDSAVDDLLAGPDLEDVVIRPQRDEHRGIIRWPLSRPDDPSGRQVVKIRYPEVTSPQEPRVHPGYDWFTVLEGTARLLLGQREILVREGQAASFDTMTPHAFGGAGGPVEMLMIFDRHGERVHLDE